mgnify:CR=1 FL=1
MGTGLSGCDTGGDWRGLEVWRKPGFNGSSDSQGLTSLDLYGFDDGVP